MVNRDDFAAKTKKIIEWIAERNNELAKRNKKLVYFIEDRKILTVDNTFIKNNGQDMHNGYSVTASGVKYFGHNVVLATGAGPHRPPQFANDFNRSYGSGNGKFKDRVIDMDHFARIAHTLKSDWDRMGAIPKSKLRVAICGPNASLDTVDSQEI